MRSDIQTSDEIGTYPKHLIQWLKNYKHLFWRSRARKISSRGVLLQFSNYSEKHCVCLVDIISSTKIIANLSETQTSEFYKIFLNSISTIIKKFDDVVVKNIGDALLLYFLVLMHNEETILEKYLNCCMFICDSHGELMKKIKDKKLPVFDYRLSSTYGMVGIATISPSSVNDTFGAIVNHCSKINYTAPKNVLVGQDFYYSAKSFPEFNFDKVGNETLDTAYYPSYVVTKRNG